MNSVSAAAFFTCLISLCESPSLSPHSVLAEVWDVVYRPNRTVLWCLLSSWNCDVRMWPISTDTSRIYFLPSTTRAEVPVTALERMRCTSALYYLTPVSFAMYLSMFPGPFASIFKGKDLGTWYMTYQSTRHAPENKLHIHWIRVAYLRHTQPFFSCPCFTPFFALRPLASLYNFLICTLSSLVNFRYITLIHYL